MNAEMSKALRKYKEWLKEHRNSVENARDEGLRKAVVFAEGEAKKLAMERIYRQPIPRLANGKDAYKRTGLYKATIRGYISENGRGVGFLASPVEYAKNLEYFHRKMILTDAVFNNKMIITKLIRGEISRVTERQRSLNENDR